MNPFSLLTGLGAALGLFRLQPKYLNSALVVLAAGLAGARLEYVLLNLVSFSAHPAETVMFWKGGLGWAGGLAGAGLAVLIIAAIKRISPSNLADALLPMLLPLAVTLWLACWQTGAAYGIPAVGNAWWGVPARDDLGLVSLRWPVQLVGALASLFGLAFLEKQRPRLKVPGLSACLGVAWLTAIIAALSPAMADPAVQVWGLRLYTLEAISFALISLVLALAAWFASRQRQLTGHPEQPLP